MMMHEDFEFLDSMTTVAGWTLKLGRVNRITYHEGRGRNPHYPPLGQLPSPEYQPESDTDHTVMLAVLSCMFAERYYPGLPLGRVAQFALVHDFPEALCGDTPTLKIDEAGLQAKLEREEAAYDFMAKTVPGTWLVETLAQYEARESTLSGLVNNAARYVWAMDKVMPKFTHVLNNCRTLLEQGTTLQELSQRYADQGVEVTAKTPGLGRVHWLYDTMAMRVCQTFARAGGR